MSDLVLALKRNAAWRASVHEAGHAVMALEARVPFEYVTVVPSGKSAGHLSLSAPLAALFTDERLAELGRDVSDEFCNRLAVALAGEQAEQLVIGNVDRDGCGDDVAYQQALLAHCLNGNANAIETVLTAARQTVAACLARRKAAVDALAEAMRDRGTLTFDEVTAVVAEVEQRQEGRS